MKNKELNAQQVISIAVILTDANRRIQWVNDDFCVITGYSMLEVVGKKPSILQGAGTDKAAIERLREKLNQRIPFKDEILNYRKNGEEYVCRLVVHPIFNERNELTNYIAFEIDATEISNDEHISVMHVRPKYQSSSLTDAQELSIFAKLLGLMEQKRLYLNYDLKLRDLSELLKTNTRYLSQVINNQTGENFIHFVNQYRVDEAKKRIVDEKYQYLTTFAVAQACGFKNKSTFYKVFKEFTLITPNEYVKKHQHQGEEVFS